jgi:hypothetical protein
MKLESLLQYVDRYLGIPEHPDYPNALNGLQVGGAPEVSAIAAAVDASLAAIEAMGLRCIRLTYRWTATPKSGIAPSSPGRWA